MSAKKLKSKSILLFSILLIAYSALLLYIGAWLIKNGYEYYLKNFIQNKFYNPFTTFTAIQNSGQLTAQYKWIKIPNEKKSRYGGLIYNDLKKTFIYGSQDGYFYNINKDGKINLNSEIPKIPIQNYKKIPDFIEEDRLGLRNIYFDSSDNSYTALVSELDVDNQCHYIKVLFFLKNSKWKNLDKSPCWNYGTTGSIGGGLVKIKNNIYYSTGFNTLFYPQNVPDNIEAKIEKDMLGKVVKLDINTGAKKIFANGLRNPLGLAISENNKIYEIEMGPQGGDEINIIEENKNYGYPYQTLGVDYGKKIWPFFKDMPDHKVPIYSFIPSAGPSHIIFDKSFRNKNRLADCQLLITTLRHQSLYFARLNNECTQIQNLERVILNKRLRRIAASYENITTYAISTDGTNEIALIVFR